MDIVERLRERARRLVVLDCELGTGEHVQAVYQVRRPSARELAVHKVPELPGLASVVALAQVQEQETIARQRLNDCRTDEERAALEAQLAEERTTRLGDVLAEATRDPADALALLARADAHVMSCVEAVGVGLPGTRVGPHDAETTPAEICELIEPGVWLRPVRIVDREIRTDGELALTDLPESDRVLLFIFIGLAFNAEVGALLRTFRVRGGGTAAGAGGPVGDAVRAAAAPTAGPVAGGRGVRRARAGGGDAR